MKILEAVKKGLFAGINLKGLVGLLFAFNAIFNIITSILAPKGTPAEQISPVVSVVVFILTLVFVLLSIFVQGGAFNIIKEYIKTGSKALAGFVNFGKKFYLRLLGVAVILMVVLLLVAFLVVLVMALGFASKNNMIGIVLGLIIGLVGLLFIFLLSLSPYALVTEDISVFASLRKSIDTVRNNFFKILGIFLFVLVLAFLSGLVIGLIVGILSLIIKSFIAQQIISAILMSGLNAYVTVFASTALMSYYLAITAGSPQKPITQAT